MQNSKILSVTCVAVLFGLFVMVISSWVTKNALDGGQRLPEQVRFAAIEIADFPIRLKGLIVLAREQFRPIGVNYIYNDYEPKTGVKSKIQGDLLLSYIDKNGLNQIRLINLSTKKFRELSIKNTELEPISYSDHLRGSEPFRHFAASSRYRVWHPYLSKEGLITYSIPWNDLISVDLKTGKIRWRIRGSFHHSIESDGEGGFWVCGATEPGSSQSQNSKAIHSNTQFEDQVVVKVSPDGKIQKVISVADMIVASKMEYLLYGISNPNISRDPIHLNQVTPVLVDCGLLKKGYLILSLRNLSTILLIDPKSERVVWHQSGPWMAQHSVQITKPSTIFVLDNHSFVTGQYWLNEEWKTRVLQHDLKSNQTAEVTVNNRSPRSFRIPIEGRATQVGEDSWMIEDCVQGTILIFEGGELVFKWDNKYTSRRVGVTSWCRYLPPGELKEDEFWSSALGGVSVVESINHK